MKLMLFPGFDSRGEVIRGNEKIIQRFFKKIGMEI